MSTATDNRDRFKALAYRYRHLPGDYGLRPHTVEVRIRHWSGTHTGDGTASGSWAAITEANGQPPKVRWLSTEELAVGDLQAGAVEIGPVTPDFSGGGTTAATIRGTSASVGDELEFRITGPTHPSGAVYVATNTNFGKALHYTFQARPVADS